VLARHAPFAAEMQKDEFVDVVERYMREAQGGWLDMAWFANVEDAAAAATAAAAGGDSVDADTSEDEDGDARAPSRKRRRGSEDDGVEDGRKGGGEMCMFAVDWLSEERTREYRKWKEGVLAEIERKVTSARRR
jgi:hypothetical protein